MDCALCPRRCGVPRPESISAAPRGVCGMGLRPVVARAGLHHWEEPCISGSRGSGAVFFSGCPLRCCFCQNYAISAKGFGKEITVERLREIYHELAALGAHNINLVNPTHFLDAVEQSLSPAPPVPVVYNSSGYELAPSLRRLEGKVQIYLPDLKYSDDSLAMRYSHAPDYTQAAEAAILEMHRQTGDYRLDGDGMLQSGVIIRHLILPGQPDNTFGVIDWVAEHFRPGQVLFSLMAQYTPCGDAARHPEINRRLTPEEYSRIRAYLSFTPIEDGFFQELSSATQEYIPEFDCSGV